MRRGFTLIELLVVIAIIAILAAILFPVFLSAREMAQATKCGAHGKQVGTAMLMYLDDNNGRFPCNVNNPDVLAKLSAITWRYQWPGDPRPGHDIWSAAGATMRYYQLYKYTKNQDIWVCPNPNGLYALKYVYGYRCSWCFVTRQYMYNPDLDKYPDAAFQTEARMGEVEGLGRTIPEMLSIDRSHWHRYTTPTSKVFAFCYALGPDVSWRTETYAGSGKCEPPLFPHKDGTIYVYCDGHAKYSDTGCGWAPVGYTDQHIDRKH